MTFQSEPHRLFLGIPLPKEVSQNMMAFSKPYHEFPGIRWIPENNLHITTYFFGSVADEMVENLKSLIYLALRDTATFELEFDRYCFAPGKKDPRMVWARYKKSSSFRELVSQISALYLRVKPDQQMRKSPVPHVTLARLRDFRLHEQISFEHHLPPGRLKIKELFLWESFLQPSGAVYEIMEKYELIS